MKICYSLLTIFVITVIATITLWLTHIDRSAPPEQLQINFSATAPHAADSTAPPLRIAVAAMTSPETTEVLYRDLLESIGQRLERPVVFIQRPTYEEVDTLLQQNRIDLAFVCSGSYAFGHDTYQLELLVIPVIKGQRVYRSDIIAAKDSPFNSLESLRGKRFAFTSRSSNSGFLAPCYMLSQRQETPETFFSSIIFSKSHDKSIHAVAQGMVDGAAVDSLILDHMIAAKDRSALAVKVIDSSVDFGMPPVVVPHQLDAQLKTQLRDIFLTIHESTQGRAILDNLRIDHFTLADDHEYDLIREMGRTCKR